jgi:hypothetical protein
LERLEDHGFHLSTAVHALWAGQRDPAVLTAGLDATDTALIGRILALTIEAEDAQRRTTLLARASAAVAAVGDDLQARVELVERLRTAAKVYTSGKEEDRALAARLRELVVQVEGGEGEQTRE